MTIQPPPIYNQIAAEDGKATIPWTLFFNQLFTGDQGTEFTPTFTSLTTTGTPTITGRYYKNGALTVTIVKIVPGTDTSATAGTTYCNFPLTAQYDGFCVAVSGLLGSGTGMIEASTSRIYVPSWSAVTVPLTVIGVAIAR